MKILIIGGTRFFGPDIVNLLSRAGHEATVLSNEEQPPRFENTRFLYGDRRDLSFLRKIARSQAFDVIIDNIACGGRDVQECLAAFQGRAEHYILTSTAWVYKTLKPQGKAFSETDLPAGRAVEPQRELSSKMLDYVKNKLEAENVLMSQNEIKCTIFRPCMIAGPNDHNLRIWFYVQRLMDKQGIIVREPENAFQLLYKKDVAFAYQKAAESLKEENQVFNLCPDEKVSARNIIEICGRTLGLEPKICSFGGQEIAAALPEYINQEPFNAENDIYDGSKVVEELAIGFVDYEQWLGETALWCAKQDNCPSSAGYESRGQEIKLCQKIT